MPHLWHNVETVPVRWAIGDCDCVVEMTQSRGRSLYYNGGSAGWVGAARFPSAASDYRRFDKGVIKSPAECFTQIFICVRAVTYWDNLVLMSLPPSFDGEQIQMVKTSVSTPLHEIKKTLETSCSEKKVFFSCACNGSKAASSRSFYIDSPQKKNSQNVTCSDRNSFSRVWCGKSELGHFPILPLSIKTWLD